MRLLCILLLACTAALHSAEGLSVSFNTTTAGGGYNPSHVMAVWIETSGAAFVRTIGDWSGNKAVSPTSGRRSSLTQWRAKAGTSDSDAYMGATVNSHAVRSTSTWDMASKAVPATAVADGTYNVWLESVDANTPAAGTTSRTGANRFSFSFAKDGVTRTHSATDGTGKFVSISYNYTGRTPTGLATATALAAGSPVTFSLTNNATPIPTAYQWRKGGTNITGATSATYTIASTVVGDAASYDCIVTYPNSYTPTLASSPTMTSSAVTITVSATATAPTISTQPANITVNAGATASFTVAASGTSPFTYQWQISTNAGGTWANTSTGSGSTSATYTTAATVGGDSGNRYRCTVTNSAGSATSNGSATLTVNTAPTFTTAPSNSTVTAPATATFTIAASGTPTPTYQWQVSTNNGGTWANVSTGTGGTTTSYTTAATVLADSGKQFRCVATNSFSSTNGTAATLTVNTIPAFTTQPVAQSALVGNTAIFTVVASGSPTPTYQWQTNGSGSWANVSTGTGSTSASYTTAALALLDSGTQFRCVASNSAGSSTSNAVAVTVSAGATAPAITTDPVAATVTAPATATFSVAASGSPSPTFQWQVSTNSGGTWANVSTGTGGTTSSYTTAATVLGNSGNQYRCIATNSAGSDTSLAATLTVNTVPVVTTQPAGSTVTVPATATFTVVASGSPAPTYQWEFSTDSGATWGSVSSGTGGTTASYTTAATVTGDNGRLYRCVATNSAGSDPSSAATLTVQAAGSVGGIAYVSLTPSSAGGSYSPKHVLAVWIEDNGGTFIRTIGNYSATTASGGRRYNLAQWEAQSGGSDTEAVMGATRLAFSPVRNLSWDLKAAGSPTVVADGNYRLWIEMVDEEGVSAGTSSVPGASRTSVPFTISGGAVTAVGPVSQDGFSSISISSIAQAVPVAATSAGAVAPTTGCGTGGVYGLLLGLLALGAGLRRRRTF